MALAVIFTPLNNWFSIKIFHKKERSSFSALLTLVFIILVVILPVAFVIWRIYFEIVNMYNYLVDQGKQIQLIYFLNKIQEFLSKYFSNQFFGEVNFANFFSKILDWLLSNLSTIFSNLTWFTINTFVLFFGLFYFLKNGHEIKREIIVLSPFEETDNKILMGNLKQSIYAIFGGSIVVSLIQGILTGIGLAIFGVPSPVLWGSVAALTSLIPGIGTSIVLIPAILYLFFSSTVYIAAGLLTWGVLVVGLIDNFLKPLLIAPGMRVHPFLIFLSIIGGLALFGVVGFLVGPLTLAFLFALLEIYKSSRKQLSIRP